MRRMRKASYKKNGKNKNDQGSKDTNVFKYPFSMKTVAAKIPDGSITLSSGQRFQVSNSFKCPISGVGYIALLPSFRDAFLYSALANNTTTPPAAFGVSTAANADIGVAPLAGDPAVNLAAVWNAIKYPNQLELADDAVKQRLAKWRLVSTGLKISLTNSSEYNDGYFEAIRLSIGVVNMANNEDALRNQLNAYVAAANTQFIDQPSYTTGKLRDIHKFVFQCKPDGINHDFNANTDTLDNGFDCVLIRLTGRTVTAEAENSPLTQVLVHAVSNQEIVYQSNYELSRFHTECVYSRSFQARAAARWVDVKAAYRSLQS